MGIGFLDWFCWLLGCGLPWWGKGWAIGFASARNLLKYRCASRIVTVRNIVLRSCDSGFLYERGYFLALFIHDQSNDGPRRAATCRAPSAMEICLVFCGWIDMNDEGNIRNIDTCLLYTSPSPRDRTRYRMPSSA